VPRAVCVRQSAPELARSPMWLRRPLPSGKERAELVREKYRGRSRSPRAVPATIRTRGPRRLPMRNDSGESRVGGSSLGSSEEEAALLRLRPGPRPRASPLFDAHRASTIKSRVTRRRGRLLCRGTLHWAARTELQERNGNAAEHAVECFRVQVGASRSYATIAADVACQACTRARDTRSSTKTAEAGRCEWGGIVGCPV
jgi:hypothetical protein